MNDPTEKLLQEMKAEGLIISRIDPETGEKQYRNTAKGHTELIRRKVESLNETL